MSVELNVGVIGAGRMGTWHVDAWDRIECARVVAIADPSEPAARACIRRRRMEWHADWRDLLDRDDIDAVTIAAPTEAHAEIALGAIDNHVRLKIALNYIVPFVVSNLGAMSSQ